MPNDNPQPGWWKRNWKWLLPPTFMALLFFACYAMVVNGNVTDYAQVYADAPLYENAWTQAAANGQVASALGIPEPIDKLAVLEGNAVYTENGSHIALTIRVSGSKGKAKMDIAAHRKNSGWIYEKITIRVKNPKQEIRVLDQQAK